MFYWACVCMACAIPLWMVLSNILTILLILLVLLKIIWHKGKVNSNDRLIGLAALFAIHFIALSYASNWNEGIRQLETKLSLFIFPIVFSFFNLKANDVRKILIFFIVALAFFSVLCYINAFVQCSCFYDDRDTWRSAFHRENYTDIIGDIHVSYFSTYLLFSIGIILFRKDILFHKILKVALVVLFTATILIMAGKNAIITLFLILLAYIFFKIKGRLKYIYLFIICLLLFTVVSTSSMLHERFTTSESINMKVGQWKAALQVFSSSPIIGVGPGDNNDLLVQQYLANNDAVNYKQKFGTHNQYLNILVTTGIIGLIVWFYCIVTSIKFSIEKKDLTLLLFILIFCVSIATENMLNSQKGVVYFSFFYCMFNSRN